MAKLIITRRQRFGGVVRIVIDGQRGTSIALGQTVGVELPPGRHHFMAHTFGCGSRPVRIEVGPEESQLLEIRCSMTGWHSAGLYFLVSSPWLAFDWFDPGPYRHVLGVASFIPCLVWAAYLFLCRDRFLYLKTIPSLDPIAQQVRISRGKDFNLSDLPLVQPPRLGLSIRRMMIAVAIVAVVLWAGVSLVRFETHRSFRWHVESHAVIEEMCRKEQQESRKDEEYWNESAARWGRFGKQTAALHQIAASCAARAKSQTASAAARAEYHAAMKRKYEQAIAQGRYFADPDPPAPP